MKLLINTSTILSLALYVVPPFAAQAQDLQTVMVGDQQVICLPDKKTACPDGALCAVAIDPDNCQANAEKAVADKATADQAAAEKAAADQAAADKAAADKAAADQAATDQAAADKATADQAAADQAAADKAAADQAAADQAAADKAAADKAVADQKAADGTTAPADATVATDTAPAFKTVTTADGTEVICLPNKATACPDGAVCVVAVKTAKCAAAAEKKVAALAAAAGDQTAADKAAADKAAADKAAADQTAADKAAADQAAADKAAADKAAADQTAADKAAADQAASDKAATDKAAADKAAAEQAAMDAANIAAAQKAQEVAAAAAAADPNLKPVEVPVVDEQATQTLETVLASPDAGPGTDATVQDPVSPVAAAAAEGTDLTAPLKDLPPPEPSKDVTVTTETVTKADTRSSAQDFAAAPVQVAPGKKSGLSDLEKVGLLALGALVIGAMINNNKQQVVSNTGDRVVVKQQDGSYQVYKDDNSLLRQPGSKVTTQTFKDGSTRSVVTREDGSQISTVRDASGRVLQRVAYDTKGRATVLIDDLQPERRIDVTTLPKPMADRNKITVDGGDAAMRAALASADAEDLGQKFSLRQIRTIKEVRWLAPTIDVTNITFETGSAAIQPTEARKLARLGRFITDMIDQNPGEVFLIEGHTDAVGSAASNLALSDRRAESVAKALTEYFQVPPENMVVQGYGETELAVDSGGDERANRRVAVRIITPLLQQAAE